MEGGTSSAFCPYVGGHRGGTMPPDGDSLNEGHIDVVLFLDRTLWLAHPRPLPRRKPAIIRRHGLSHQLSSHIQRGVPPMGPLYAVCRDMGAKGEGTLRGREPRLVARGDQLHRQRDHDQKLQFKVSSSARWLGSNSYCLAFMEIKNETVIDHRRPVLNFGRRLR
jgi:hypothetical protein